MAGVLRFLRDRRVDPGGVQYKVAAVAAVIIAVVIIMGGKANNAFQI